MTAPSISHNREQEMPEAKARWFQTLSLAERMGYLCFISELVLENNHKQEGKHILIDESNMLRKQVKGVFEQNGFETTNCTTKAVEFQSLVNKQYVYFIIPKSLRSYIQIVVHPELGSTELLKVPDVTSAGVLHHNHMRRFPKKMHTGAKKIQYGQKLHVDSLSSLENLLTLFNRQR